MRVTLLYIGKGVLISHFSVGGSVAMRHIACKSSEVYGKNLCPIDSTEKVTEVREYKYRQSTVLK